MVGHGPQALRGVIYQCASCRSLVSARDVTVDTAHERAALSCDACGARTWLPFAGSATSGAHVVDVTAGPSASTASPLALPTVTSTALVPSGAAAAASMWSDEQRTRIATRIDKLAPQGDMQGELAASFTALLTSWNSEAEHKNFLKKASLAGELAFAGQRYRAVLEEAPSDERAKKAQNDILALAVASMSREKDLGSAGGGDTGTQKKLLAAVVIVLGVIACIAILRYLPGLLNPEDEAGALDPLDQPAVEGVGDGQNIAPPVPGR